VLAVALLVPAAPAGAATPVTACGTVLSSPGFYALTQDLNCTGGDYSSSGIQVNSSDVNLQLNGHTITGGLFGIWIGVFGGTNVGGTLSEATPATPGSPR
jgi:hypothetical protein